jgi:hypothetical protein
VSRFLTPSAEYEPIHLKEAVFESTLHLHAGRLFPRWFLFRWDPLLESPFGKVKPDQVLIKDDYSLWYVIEVELASHHESHYRPQFNALEAAHYGSHLLDGLLRAGPRGLDQDRLREMLRSVHPNLLCIADDHSDRLSRACRDYSFELVVAEPFRAGGDYGLFVTRLPEHLRRVDPPATFNVTIQRGVLGRLRCSLPTGFPQRPLYSVRFAGQVVQGQLIQGRLLLPPLDGLQAGPASLVPIDPAEGSWELTVTAQV